MYTTLNQILGIFIPLFFALLLCSASQTFRSWLLGRFASRSPAPHCEGSLDLLIFPQLQRNGTKNLPAKILSLWPSMVYKILAVFLLLGAAPLKKEMPPKLEGIYKLGFVDLASTLTVPADAPVVIVDVGHGGRDLGARAQAPYCEEKRICLQTARLVKKHLNQLGYRVIMTRDTDVFVSLERRVEIAGQARGDLFVSIHCNSVHNPTAQGIEIWFYENREDRIRSNGSRKLAEAVLSRIIRRTEAVSRGVKKGSFYVLREAKMPAIIVESGFISNPGERALLRTSEYQDKVARGIVDGVDLFFKKKRTNTNRNK